jgi:hypothetical protein
MGFTVNLKKIDATQRYIELNPKGMKAAVVSFDFGI